MGGNLLGVLPKNSRIICLNESTEGVLCPTIVLKIAFDFMPGCDDETKTFCFISFSLTKRSQVPYCSISCRMVFEKSSHVSRINILPMARGCLKNPGARCFMGNTLDHCSGQWSKVFRREYWHLLLAASLPAKRRCQYSRRNALCNFDIREEKDEEISKLQAYLKKQRIVDWGIGR